jgi:ABC-type sugar transport system substrate-binding protein
MLGVVLAAATVAAGCGGGDNGGDTASAGGGKPLDGKELAFVLYGADQYQQAQGRAFQAAAEAQGAKVKIVDGKVDGAVQTNAVDNLVAQQPDGVAFQPIDAATAMTVRNLQQANIPAVLMGAEPPADSGVTAPFNAFSEYDTTKQAGENAAKFVAQKMKQQPKLLVLDDKTMEFCTKQRIQGFIDGVMAADPKAKLVARLSAKTDREKGMKLMEDQLQADGDFNIVTSCGSESILGGIQALEGAGRCKAEAKVPKTEYVFTIDGTPGELSKLLDPKSCVMQTMTLTPKDNGEKMLDTLVKVMNGEIKPDQDYNGDLPGVLLPADCAGVNKVFKEQYGTTVDC